MEEIKSSFDKIFEQFTADTMSYSIPKRLSYNNSINDSLESASKKRKLSIDLSKSLNQSHNKSAKDDSISYNNFSHDDNISNISNISSSWEVRRLKVDIVEYEARMNQMKEELRDRVAAYTHMESMYTGKVSGLEKQLENQSNKMKNMEKFGKHYQKRESAAQAQILKLNQKILADKTQAEGVIRALQMNIRDLESNMRKTKFEMSNEVTELSEQYSELKMNYDTLLENFSTAQGEIDSLNKDIERCAETAKNAEDVKQELETATRKISELQEEIVKFGEWKDLSKTFENRLYKLPDLEKENERLKRESKNLRDTIGNKLLLEEEVFDLKSRLAQSERNTEEAIVLKTQIKALNEELNAYKAVATEHCKQNVSPDALRSRIQDILQNDLLLMNEKGTVRNEKEVMTSQVQTLKRQHEVSQKAITDLQNSLKYHKTMLQKVQKKLLLVAKERDCYKQLIENYEKDLTISGNASEHNPDSKLRLRLDMLEKTLAGYKEMVAGLEKELQNSKSLPDIGIDSPVNNEHYAKLRSELESLREENHELKSRKELAELHADDSVRKTLQIIENMEKVQKELDSETASNVRLRKHIEELESSIKGAINTNKFKVIHMEMNPTAEAVEQHQNELEKLKAEIERLKRRNRKLEDEHQEMTVRLNDTSSNITTDIRELETLRTQIKTLESRNQHIKEFYKSSSIEFRDVCYLLFGFKIDRLNANKYRISSMYAEAEDEFLIFQFNESRALDLMETAYSRTLADLMKVTLVEHKSLPSFLATLTMELFNRTTMT